MHLHYEVRAPIRAPPLPKNTQRASGRTRGVGHGPTIVLRLFFYRWSARSARVSLSVTLHQFQMTQPYDVNCRPFSKSG